MPLSTSPSGNPQYGVDADTRVSFHRVLASQKAHYAGPVITLGTARGKTLVASPDQILLSSDGWMAVSAVRNGTRLFSYDKTTMPQGKGLRKVTPIANVHGVLFRYGNGEFRIKRAEDGSLEVGDLEGVDDEALEFLHATMPIKLEDLDDEEEQEEILPDSRGRFSPEQATKLAENMRKLIASRKPGLRKKANDLQSLMRMSPSSAYLGLSQDTVVSVTESQASIDLYALKTLEGWYVGNGFALHNCECSVTEEDGGSDE